MAALDLRPGVGWTTGAQDPFGIPTAIALVGAMTGVPALIAGFWIAPRAWRARSFGDWLVAEIVIALATDFIGLVLVAALFALPGLVAPTAGGALGALALMGVVIILGGVAVAPLVLPFTAAGGVLWVTGMWLFRAAANRVGVTGEAAP